MRLAREIAHGDAFTPFRGEEHAPGRAAQTDAEITAYIREVVQTIYHPVGTCKMGHDALAVVDTDLRVRGVEGLRVIDASIMPSVVRGNTNAPAIMIAEKGAAAIRGAA